MKLINALKISMPVIVWGAVKQALETNIQIRRYKFRHKKIKDNVRLVFISDLHNNLYGENQIELRTIIAEQKPDIVLLGGDFFDKVGEIRHTVTLLDWLGQNYPAFFITGNHEFLFRNIEEIKALVRELNIMVLEGDSLTLPGTRENITLSGIDDNSRYWRFRKELKKTGGKLDPAQFNILLIHRPERINQYQQYEFDLVLTGHAHGGQVRLPGLINGLYAPGQGLFPAYAGGKYQLNDRTSMIVNRGLMTQYQRVPRIFNPPEIVVIDLLRK